MRNAFVLLVLVSALLVGCAGPTELTNADIDAQKKQFSQENYEKSMKDAGREVEIDKQKQDEAERADERAR